MSLMRKGLLAALVLLVAGGAAMATDVTFQVRMSFQMTSGNFDPATDMLVVRGSFNDWSGVANELTDDDGDSLYTTTFDIAEGDIEYKFVIVPEGAEDVWESVDNRTATVGTDPLVLDPVWFNNQEPVETTTIDVTFQVNMSVQELAGNFDPEVDDVMVRGGTAPLEWGGSNNILESSFTDPDIYTGTITFTDVPIGTPVEYKYFIIVNGDAENGIWESVPGGGNRTFEPGTENITIEPVYFSGVGPDDILTEPLDVAFRVNIQPPQRKIEDPDSAIVDVQSGDTVHVINSVNVAGFFNNWPWGGFDPAHTLANDGQGYDDAADDMVYSGVINFDVGSPVELVFKYGLNGYDVEAGFASDRVVDLSDATFVDDAGTYIIYNVFGSNGTLYDPYMDDLDVREDEDAPVPSEFVLEQNYPNPFNPTTTVAFQMPSAGDASLVVFDVMGREVYNKQLRNLNTGRYEVVLDGRGLTSGTYFYRVDAEGFSAVKKMTLLK